MQLCSFSFQLLNNFLASSEITLLLLYVLNDSINVKVCNRPPLSVADIEEHAGDDSHTVLSLGSAAVASGEQHVANLKPISLGLLKVSVPLLLAGDPIGLRMSTSQSRELLTNRNGMFVWSTGRSGGKAR